MPVPVRRVARIACSSAFLLFLSIPSAYAQLTSEEIACRAKISKGYAKVVKATTKAIGGCHKLRNKGDLAAAVDCNDAATADAQTGSKAAGASSKWRESVVDACSAVPTVLSRFSTCPAPFEATDDAGATTGTDSYDEALDCLLAHTNSILADAATTALGAPSPPLATGVAKCHGAIAKGFAKTIDTILKVRNLCQSASDKSGGDLEFDCFTTDDDAKVALTIAKSGDVLEKSCVADVALADSCSTMAGGIETCALSEAAAGAADLLSALGWESKRSCPGAVTMAMKPGLFDLDIGWTGGMHDEESVTDADLLRFPITCDADCTGCTGTPTVIGDHCRCSGDSSQSCSANGDCAGFGGECRCYWGPPAPATSPGVILCSTSTITSISPGSAVPATGDATVQANLAVRYHAGIALDQPCPTCEAGLCNGGARDGLSCTSDSTDPVLGDTSLDCMPNPANNITGTGLRFGLNLSTGSFSMPFNVPCDAPLGAEMCACSTCSLDNLLACNDDATCASAGAGVCRTDSGHGGEPRRPNRCDDGMCQPIGEQPTEGVCPGGPSDKFCDGLVRENGRGVFACSIDADCNDATCFGGSCGTCSLYSIRRCFPDPIASEGIPGEALVGGGCTPASASGVLNDAHGWPGPFRIRQAFELHSVMCPDGVTPFKGPGGSNCP